MPPSHFMNQPKGKGKRLCLPIQNTFRRSFNTTKSMSGKSQLLVCGAAISTKRAFSIGRPTTLQPMSLRMPMASQRSSGVMMGVEKTVLRMAASVSVYWLPRLHKVGDGQLAQGAARAGFLPDIEHRHYFLVLCHAEPLSNHGMSRHRAGAPDGANTLRVRSQ